MQYFKDLLLGMLLGLLLGGPLLWAILWLMERAGAYWWLAAWATWMAFTLTITCRITSYNVCYTKLLRYRPMIP